MDSRLARREAESRTRLHRQRAFGKQAYSAVGCMTEATTTLMRAAWAQGIDFWLNYRLTAAFMKNMAAAVETPQEATGLTRLAAS